MYGSIFCSVTRKPRASRSDPIEAAAKPLPNDDTTPPVTKMYFVATSAYSRHPVSDLCDLHRARRRRDGLRLVASEGQRPALAGRDAEAARPHPRERPGQLGDGGRGRGGEAVRGVRGGEGAAPSEPRERQLGARLGEDPLELG